MNVLILHDTSNYAGTESHIFALAMGLSNIDGVRVELLVPESSHLQQHCETSGICHHVSRQNVLSFFLQTLRVVRKHHTQVLHAHNGRTATIAVLVRNLTRCKVVVTQHFLEPAHVSDAGLIGWLKRVVHQWVGKQIDYRICVSEAALHCMVRRGDVIAKTADQVRVIYSGIAERDSRRETRELCKASVLSELELPSNSQLIFTAARLEREKTIDDFIRAMVPICLIQPATHAVIAGDGNESSKLRLLAQEVGISQQIHFLGFRSDVNTLMLAADIFVLSSSVESFGMVLLEAMVCRTPVIAPNGGGPKEIIVDRKSGLFYSPRNVDELTSAISELLVKPDLRASLAECGYTRVIETFSVQRMVHDTLRVYSSLLSGGSDA